MPPCHRTPPPNEPPRPPGVWAVSVAVVVAFAIVLVAVAQWTALVALAGVVALAGGGLAIVNALVRGAMTQDSTRTGPIASHEEVTRHDHPSRCAAGEG
jgi:hypothetical protein